MGSLEDAFHVVAMDMRGVADSRPAPNGGYRINELLPDIACVLDATAGPGGRAHLIGHDWGSTIGWSFITDPQFRRRALSWQSISGPHLALWIRWMAEGLRSLRLKRVLPVLGQLLRSSYVVFLIARPIPELFWWLGGVPAWRLVLRIAGVPADDPMLEETRDRMLSMALRPMALYRQNILRLPAAPERSGITTPTHLIIPTKDPFVSQRSFDTLDQYVTSLQVTRLPARHWAQRSHPIEIAAEIRRFLLEQNRKQAPLPA